MIFIDELDGLAQKRGQTSEHRDDRETMVQLLQELDGKCHRSGNSSGKVFFKLTEFIAFVQSTCTLTSGTDKLGFSINTFNQPYLNHSVSMGCEKPLIHYCIRMSLVDQYIIDNG